MTRPEPPVGRFEPEITDADVGFFREHGFWSIERITTDEEIAWLGEVFDDLFRVRSGGLPGGYFDVARPYGEDGPVRLAQTLFPETRVPALRDTLYQRNARRIAARLLGVDATALQGWGHMILKPAGDGHETPWHQDEAYWEPGFDYQAIAAWLPLDDADAENGCLWFLPGSHRGEVRPHRHLHDDPAVHALVTDPGDVSGAVCVPVRAGGASFHHPRTLHHAGPNHSSRRRRAYATELQTPPVPRAVAVERPWIDEGKAACAARQPAR